MPGFESPISGRKFTAAPMKDLEIPDETGYGGPPPPPHRPTRRDQFVQSAGRQYSNNPMTEQEIAEFQQRMQDNMNPDSQLSDIEREIKQARQEKLRAQTNLSDGARRRIEMLIGMTRVTREVIIENNNYVLQTLKGKEMREAIMMASEYDGTVQSPFEIRRQMLARSLCRVANVPIEQFIGDNSLEARLDFVDELDDMLLNRLMDEYSELTKEAKSKYAMTTPEQVQEVAEDLKK